MLRKIGNFFKKIISPTNWKRWLILFITLVSTIVAIVCGSIFFTSKNINKSVEYNGGVEFLIKINKGDKPDEAIDEKFSKEVSKAIEERLNGGVAFNGTSVEVQGNGKIRITKNGELSKEERSEFEKIISNKPTLILTDSSMIPLFIDGEFNRSRNKLDYDLISSDPKELRRYVAPLKPNGSEAILTGGQYGQDASSKSVSVTLLNYEAQLEWEAATEFISTQTRDKAILMWINLDDLINMAKEDFYDDWVDSGKNPYNFVHVDNKIFNSSNNTPNAKKLYTFDAKKYLISEARVGEKLSAPTFRITGRFSDQEARQLSANINYGSSNYSLDVLSSNYVQPDNTSNSFESALLAGAVVFGLISIFMIVNYGVLGLLSTVSISLYMFLTLLMFAFLQGEYSPVTIAALIIGIGISVDSNIIVFERLKNEVYSGERLKKSMKLSNKKSLSSIIDANITTLIVSFILFYFGTSKVKGFSISLIFSVIFTLVVMLLFTRTLSQILINTGVFDNRIWLLGMYKKKINNINQTKGFRSFNFIKHAKWFVLGSLLFILIGGIVYGSFAGINNDFWAGFNRSIEFRGGVNISLQSAETSFIDHARALEIKDYIINHNDVFKIDNIENYINIIPADSNKLEWKVVIETPQNLTARLKEINSELAKVFKDTDPISFGISSIEAQELLKNAMLSIGISFAGIIIYTMVRLKWTFSTAAIIGLLHDIVMTISFVVITRLQMSPIIIAAMLSIIAFSINDTVVVFDRIRETINNEYHNQILSKEQIAKIANSSIADVFKRSIYTSATTIAAVAVLLMFGNATDLSFNIMMVFGLAIGSYSSIFIATRMWTILENRRQKGIKHRMEKGFWNLPGPTEQIFQGINDYTA
ncbi:protein translocase subunit SecDF [Mycoplasma sp. Mirounga ES2805-ORL]|uniref:protein translocase subunit SecDF n=1 Tax=Mycoplasma sp. Mirounga ES2805-ORL TaxID=754514 RepID=UPI00197B1F28|nr:protein translocase subunit SecDF [Mycoplasma sp. Mirounga ES2805-ORL]QSF13687.1 protein translocase subunit SecDF [Mycoplasma sp. Mirounga ES2805-ORL]